MCIRDRLITARLAGEAGREVMAVPGSPLDPRAQGCNLLIREGATLIQSAADVLEALASFDPRMVREPVAAMPSAFAASEASEPANITGLLGPVPVPVDEIIRLSGAAAAAEALRAPTIVTQGRAISAPSPFTIKAGGAPSIASSSAG